MVVPVLLLASMFTNASAEIADSLDLKAQSKLVPVGSGKLNWFGFTIYEASLWNSNGAYKGLDENLPIALHITYRREIDSKALAQRTVEEWEQLGIYSSEKRELWAKRLTTIWPSVKPGDSITTLVTDNKQTRFYHNSQFLQSVDDPEFGLLLLSIWLHPDTSEPELRKELIGQRES